MSDEILTCKPLHRRSEDELLDYVREMEANRTMEQERSIMNMVDTFMEHRERYRNMPHHRPPFLMAPASTSYSLTDAAPPVATLNFRNIEVRVPDWCKDDEARWLAERMIREQIGDMHLPWSTP